MAHSTKSLPELPARIKERLAARKRQTYALDDRAKANVLVPLWKRGRQVVLILEIRHADLTIHGGEIAFPGGRPESQDHNSPIATALREANEEIHLEKESVKILGLGDDQLTPNRPSLHPKDLPRPGHVITPVLGWIEGKLDLRAQPTEVEKIFFVSLDALRDPALYEDGGTRVVDKERNIVQQLHIYNYNDEGIPRKIWGVTARIIHQTLELAAP